MSSYALNTPLTKKIKIMFMHSIFTNYLKRTLRSPFGKWILGGNILGVICIWIPIFIYAFYIGFYINDYFNVNNIIIVYILTGWEFFINLFLRRRMHISFFPYLIIPISRNILSLFCQIIILFGRLNLISWAFLIGYWMQNIYLKNIDYSWNLLLTICLFYICIQLMINIFCFCEKGRWFLVLYIMFFALGIGLLELWFNVQIINKISIIFFNATLKGSLWPILFLVTCAGILFYESMNQINTNLYIDHLSLSYFEFNRIKIFSKKRKPYGLMAELLSCEWKLIFRNRFINSIFLILIVIIFFIALIDVGLVSQTSNSSLLQGVISVFVIFSHAQIHFIYAFDYRSSFYDCLQSIPISEKTILKTILLISHRFTLFGLSLFVFIVILINIIINDSSFPLWIILIGNMLYGMGIVNFATLCVNIFHPIPRNIDLKYYQFIPNISMPNVNMIYIILFPMISFSIQIWFLNLMSAIWTGVIFSVLGFIGLCLQNFLLTLLANNLHKRKYIIMERFRRGYD